jgi:hypothetical protein
MTAARSAFRVHAARLLNRDDGQDESGAARNDVRP